MSIHRLWEATDRNSFRGLFYFPTLDLGKQLPEWTREIIAAKINWLYNNVPYVRAAVDGLALDEVATGIWPKAATSSRAFNKAATDRFHEHGKDARFFDARRIETAYSSQFLVRRSIYLSGEIFSQMLRPGEGRPWPSQHFIPAWQIGTTGDKALDAGWDEGVQTDDWGAAVQYRAVYDKEKKAYEDIPADDLLHMHDGFGVGQKRGISCLAAVAKKLFTLKDIEQLTAAGILSRSMTGYAIERELGSDPIAYQPPGSVGSEVTEATATTPAIKVEKIVLTEGQDTTVADLQAGWKIKVLESNQAAEPLAFKADVLTDVAHCFLYPPEYVFHIASMGQGTVVRHVMQRAQTVKNNVRENQLIPQYLEPVYRFNLWQDIKHGLFAGVEGGIPADWWKVKWISPANDTVDLGREGRLYDERHATNKMSPNKYHGMGGDDPLDVAEEVLEYRDEVEERLAEHNTRRAAKGLPPLTYDQVWPANSNAAANAAAKKPEDEETGGGGEEEEEEAEPPIPPKNRLNGSHVS